jgi:hypothetical protein
MIKKINLIGAMAIAAAAMITSCKKSNSLQEELAAPRGTAVSPLPTAPGQEYDFEDAETKGYLIWLATGTYGARNFHQGTVADLTDSTKWATKAGTYYYSFTDHDGLSGGATSGYHFKFTGSATADFTVDLSRFRLRYINTDFNSVSDTTSSTLIAGGVASYNSITGIGNSASAGWYVYSLATHTVVAYTPRTYFIIDKTTPANRWKIRINSIYWNATPVGTPPTNYPYFSFDYKKI